MRLLAKGDRISKGSQGGEPGFFRAHALREIVFDLPVNVIAQLFVEFRIQAAAMDERADPHGNGVDPVFKPHLTPP